MTNIATEAEAWPIYAVILSSVKINMDWAWTIRPTDCALFGSGQ